MTWQKMFIFRGPEEDEALNQIKSLLSNPPILQ